ncbi:hypothetical protein Sarmat_00825 [Rickettsiales endosymbiont of Paramecium tredecaurelia]|nr:hypothetical protein [Candidatus Sarmatiella mevalonica]
MIRYSKIAKHSRVFLRLFGMELEKFEIIIKKLEKIWDKRVVGQYKRPGRNYKLGLEEMTLMLLIDLFPNSTPDGNCGDAVDAQVLTYFMYAAALCFVYSSHLRIMSEFRKRSNVPSHL